MTQTAHSLRISNGEVPTLDYLLHVPSNYSTDRKWPFILFLHGVAERGSDVHIVKNHGIARVVEYDPNFPFIAASPQCPADSAWTDLTAELYVLVQALSDQYALDPARLYLTGLSMGGYGTWRLAVTYPSLFAAIAPVCGGATFAVERVCRVKDLPIWAFHGAADEIVPLSESEKLVQELKACGGNVKFTIYPGVKHDSWTQTYNNPELYHWFLSHSRHNNK